MTTPTNHREAITVDSWPAFALEDATYDLTHLNAYTAVFQRPFKAGKQLERYTVRITFSHHCFTTGLPLEEEEGYDPALRYDHEGDERLFNQRRWMLSKRLPALIEGLRDRKCLQTGKGNFLSLNMVDEHGNTVEYEIYFRTWKPGRGQIHLHVESAYVRDPVESSAPGVGPSRPKGVRPIAFLTILHNTLNGIPIRA